MKKNTISKTLWWVASRPRPRAHYYYLWRPSVYRSIRTLLAAETRDLFSTNCVLKYSFCTLLLYVCMMTNTMNNTRSERVGCSGDYCGREQHPQIVLGFDTARKATFATFSHPLDGSVCQNILSGSHEPRRGGNGMGSGSELARTQWICTWEPDKPSAAFWHSLGVTGRRGSRSIGWRSTGTARREETAIQHLSSDDVVVYTSQFHVECWKANKAHISWPYISPVEETDGTSSFLWMKITFGNTMLSNFFRILFDPFLSFFINRFVGPQCITTTKIHDMFVAVFFQQGL